MQYAIISTTRFGNNSRFSAARFKHAMMNP
jgi:hypothetical protein